MDEGLIYGINSISEALNSERTFEKVFILKGSKNERLDELIKELRDQRIPFSFVPIQKFKPISRKNHQGIYAIISQVVYQSLDNLVDSLFSQGAEPFLVAADSITDVRNIGAIARSAQAFGAHGLLVPSKGGAMINSEAVKASAGSLMTLPVCRTDSLRFALKFLKDSGFRVISISEKTENSLWEGFDASGPIVLVLGSEGSGVSQEILKISDELLAIPMASGVGSLNVSVAAGISFSEVLRSRSKN